MSALMMHKSTLAKAASHRGPDRAASLATCLTTATVYYTRNIMNGHSTLSSGCEVDLCAANAADAAKGHGSARRRSPPTFFYKVRRRQFIAAMCAGKTQYLPRDSMFLWYLGESVKAAGRMLTAFLFYLCAFFECNDYCAAWSKEY